MLLYFGWRFSVDPEREMMWLWTLILDFPIGFVYLYFEVPSHFLTAIISIVLGGLEWALVGWLLDLLRKRFSTSSLRDHPSNKALQPTPSRLASSFSHD